MFSSFSLNARGSRRSAVVTNRSKEGLSISSQGTVRYICQKQNHEVSLRGRSSKRSCSIVAKVKLALFLLRRLFCLLCRSLFLHGYPSPPFNNGLICPDHIMV